MNYYQQKTCLMQNKNSVLGRAKILFMLIDSEN